MPGLSYNERAFREWLHSVDTVILLCWDLGHVFDRDLYASIERGPSGERLCTGKCKRGCGTEKTRYLTASWVTMPGRALYKWPKHYSPRGMMREGFFMDKQHKAMIRREIDRRKGE